MTFEISSLALLRPSSWIKFESTLCRQRKFHPEYDEGMWRRWRRDHLDYIDQLLPTVDAIPPAILQELTQLAVICRPEIVREALLDVFADAASGSCEQELETAALFFDWVIKDVRDWPDGRAKGARSQMMHWLAVTYPLSQPAGFINSAASFGQDFTML